MNPLLKEFLESFLKWVLMLIVPWFVTNGILTEEQAHRMLIGLVAAAVPTLPILARSLYVVFRKRQKLLVALSLDAPKTETAVEHMVKQGGAPSTTTPKTQVPQKEPRCE